MLIGSVVLYLLLTIAIGLWAAQRVHNAKDYVVAGRSLPLYMSAVPPQLIGLAFSIVGMVLGSLVPRAAGAPATTPHGER